MAVSTDGIGVRHREHLHVPAGGRGQRPAGDVLLVLASRRTQVRVEVDEARQDEHAAGLDDAHASGRRHGRADRGHLAALDQDVGLRVDPAQRVDDAAAADEQVGGRQRLVPGAFHQSTSSPPASL